MISTKKNLLIGANSFLSRVLSQLLLDAGQRVEGVIHKNSDKLLAGISYYSSEDLGNLPDDFDTLYIISAHIPTKIESDTNAHLFDSNVRLTETLCKQFPSAKIIYASSVSVYGEQAQLLYEQDAIAPNNVYGISKLWGEHIVRQANKYAVLRISSMYGVGMNLHTFLPRTIQQALNGNITIWGDGQRQQNYISVFAVAQYLLAAANCQDNGTYLAVDNTSYSNIEIAKLIQQHCPCAIDFFGNDNSSSYYYNNNESRNKLNIDTRENLKENLEALIQWIKKM